MTRAETIEALVESGDEADLMRVVDRLCAQRQWDDLARLRGLLTEASARGRPTWSLAEQIAYRLALEAPAEFLRGVLVPGAGRFALGPLTEVAAQSHSWRELSPVIDHPEVAAVVANERVLRGENLAGAVGDLDEVVEIPASPAGFETDCLLPLYKAREADFDQPKWPENGGELAVGISPGPPASDSTDKIFALRSICDTWAVESNGSTAAAVVTGDARSAVAHIWKEFTIWEVSAAEAYAHMQWAGASGGAEGRRRGGAAGRFSAWYSLAVCTGAGWPVDISILEGYLDEASFYLWWPNDAVRTGWALRVAAEFHSSGVSIALEATDRARS